MSFCEVLYLAWAPATQKSEQAPMWGNVSVISRSKMSGIYRNPGPPTKGSLGDDLYLVFHDSFHHDGDDGSE